MIRRSPAETYIKYLLLHPKNYTNQDIEQILEFAQLDYLGDWYVDRLRSELRAPKPFHPFDRTHRTTRDFLLKSGLIHIFQPDEHGKTAFKILEKPRVKEFIESMLVVNAPAPAIAHAVTAHRNMKCTVEAVHRYQEFFWNTDLLDSTELRALMHYRVDKLQHHSNTQVQQQHASMSRAYWNDSRKTAADLPFSPAAAVIVQMRMGLHPSQVDLAKLMDQTRGLLILRGLEAIHVNDKGASERAVNFTSILEKLTFLLEKVQKPDEEMRKDLTKIALRTEPTGVPSIHALSEGDHTVEIRPPQETTNELPAPDDLDSGDEG